MLEFFEAGVNEEIANDAGMRLLWQAGVMLGLVESVHSGVEVM